jgi:DNA-binding CsgD family transcriptional regulator
MRRGLYARGLVEHDAARLQEAATIFERLHHVFEVATIRAVVAGELASMGDHAGASAQWELALAVFDGIGARPDADRARAQLRKLQPGRARGTAPPRAVEGWEALTRTELEVVEEVCAGRSNAQVADRLGVSRRTVEAHLRSVYAKLRVPTRLGLSVAYQDRRAGREPHRTPAHR